MADERIIDEGHLDSRSVISVDSSLTTQMTWPND